LGSKSKNLRTGFTTGACAAAAAKAATLALLQKDRMDSACVENQVIDIPFPDGSRHGLKVGWINCGGFPQGMFASIIKDAGDDPDVTNGAEIQAKVVFSYREGAKWGNGEMGKSDSPISNLSQKLPLIVIKGGKGVGRVTRPGLPVPVGEPAINPGPRNMIQEAVIEALRTAPDEMIAAISGIEVTIWVPEGESIAGKTLNSRLGILGGISILGTTGIVRPISAEAWTATISTSMSVARATGRTEIVISSGRSSEKAHMEKYGLPEECYVMMGDYVEYSLLEAKRFGFHRVHLVARWAKMLKAAMAIPQTHVRHGAIDLVQAAAFLKSIGLPELSRSSFNTAREMFDLITASDPDFYRPLLTTVCEAAKGYAESVTHGVPVTAHLVSYEGGIVARNE
jgi:cobalt-precorrin-5B (C1)-methyltransferase